MPNPSPFVAVCLVTLVVIATLVACGPRQETRSLYKKYHARVEHLLPLNEACLDHARSLIDLNGHMERNTQLVIDSVAPHLELHARGLISDQTFRMLVKPIHDAEERSNQVAINQISVTTGWTHHGVLYCEGYVSAAQSKSCRGSEHIYNDDALVAYEHPATLGYVAYCLDNDFDY